MLKTIISEAVSKLREHGASPVYSAFDGIPTERKGRCIYTVVGVGSFESSVPIYSFSTIFLPFKAELEIKVTAPDELSAEQLCEYFTEHIAPAAEELSGLGSHLKRVTIKYDSNIDRLVLCAVVSVSGTARLERGASA